MFSGIGTPIARCALMTISFFALVCGPAREAGAQTPPEASTVTGVDVAAATQLYADARAADEAGSYTNALTLYRSALKKYPLAPQAATAQYRVAELLEAAGELSKAFNAYQALLTKYPDTPNFERAVAAQVSIANKFLEGRPQKIFGMPIGSSAKRAQEMYAGILANAPFSKYAPVAQFNLGLAYEKQNTPFEAIKSYQKVLDTYPNSDVCDDALYQIGYVYMRIGLATQSQDLSSLVAARNTFEDFLIEYPESEKAGQARENLTDLGGAEADDVFRIARFYEFTKDLKAATIYYKDVIRRQPNTKEAERAKARIDELVAQYGEDAIYPGPEKAETGEKVALRRRLQAQVETSSLADFTGPPKRDIVPDELPAQQPQMRTNMDDLRPLPAEDAPPLPTP
jgi:outer membrane protein assembly factor BamD